MCQLGWESQHILDRLTLRQLCVAREVGARGTDVGCLARDPLLGGTLATQ